MRAHTRVRTHVYPCTYPARVVRRKSSQPCVPRSIAPLTCEMHNTTHRCQAGCPNGMRVSHLGTTLDDCVSGAETGEAASNDDRLSHIRSRCATSRRGGTDREGKSTGDDARPRGGMILISMDAATQDIPPPPEVPWSGQPLGTASGPCFRTVQGPFLV